MHDVLYFSVGIWRVRSSAPSPRRQSTSQMFYPIRGREIVSILRQENKHRRKTWIAADETMAVSHLKSRKRHPAGWPNHKPFSETTTDSIEDGTGQSCLPLLITSSLSIFVAGRTSVETNIIHRLQRRTSRRHRIVQPWFVYLVLPASVDPV